MPKKFEAVHVERVEVREKTLEDFISMGMELREKKDKVQWELGDLAVDVTLEFGSKYLKDFAKGIGIPVSSLRRYRDVAKAYDFAAREEFSFCTWSIFRQFAGRENRLELLKRAHDESWSTEKAAMMTKPERIDDGGVVPEKPEMLLCPNCRRWYPVNPKEICPSRGECMEVK